MPASRSSSARTRLVLPPPEGAASTNRHPEAGGALVAMIVGWVMRQVVSVLSVAIEVRPQRWPPSLSVGLAPRPRSGDAMDAT